VDHVRVHLLAKNHGTINHPLITPDSKIMTVIGKYFPLADPPTPDDLSALGLPDKTGIRAMATGEKRSPRKGEWYLSGAIIEAYRASNDLSTQFHIAKLVVM